MIIFYFLSFWWMISHISVFCILNSMFFPYLTGIHLQRALKFLSNWEMMAHLKFAMYPFSCKIRSDWSFMRQSAQVRKKDERITGASGMSAPLSHFCWAGHRRGASYLTFCTCSPWICMYWSHRCSFRLILPRFWASHCPSQEKYKAKGPREPSCSYNPRLISSRA